MRLFELPSISLCWAELSVDFTVDFGVGSLPFLRSTHWPCELHSHLLGWFTDADKVEAWKACHQEMWDDVRSCYDHVRRVKNKFMHYRWQPRQCMAGTYCLSLSLHLAGQNFLFKMLAAAITGIAGPCNSSTSAPSALIFPGLQIRQSPSQSVWRLVQFVHPPLEFTGCILRLAAASPAFHSSCSVGLVLYTLK